MELGRKSKVLDQAFFSHGQQPRILFIRQKGGSVVEMDDTHIMAAATSLALLSIERGHVIVFEEEPLDTGIAVLREDSHVLDEL